MLLNNSLEVVFYFRKRSFKKNRFQAISLWSQLWRECWLLLSVSWEIRRWKIVLLLCFVCISFSVLYELYLTKKFDFFQTYSQFENSFLTVFFCLLLIVHFTVKGGNEAGVDLVFIRPFLLCYVNVFICKLVFLSILSTTKGGRFVSKQGQSQPRFHSNARILSLQL